MGADFFLVPHNKVSRLLLFFCSMKRLLYALGAARQGEGCGKVSLPCGGIFFMPRHSSAPFWRVRGLLFCHALCLLFLLSGVLKRFSGFVYISRKKGQKVTRVLKLFLLLCV